MKRIPWMLMAALGAAMPALADGHEKKPEFPKFEEVSEGYEKVVSTADGARSLYTLWVREKDGQMLAELPAGYEAQKHFFAMTVGSGELFAGLQGRDIYTRWERFDKRLALIAPNIETRSTGDQESKSSVSRLFTDRVLLDVPIVCMGPSGQPVIDMDDMLIKHMAVFHGSRARGANARLATIARAKAFPENVLVAFELPVGDGTLKEFHYSISQIKGTPGYKPRKADPRLGYFTTTYRDLGKYNDDETVVRYINRWHLEKRDSNLKLSPPKQPVVYYIEHTVPVRYRRFVKEGAEYWNKAFEQVGILNAIEIRQQDKTSGAHMDKDPEDVRYNFIRWLNNDIGTAIGPSRVDPNTGEILDADVILTDGWIRYFRYQFNDLLPDLAMNGMSPETLAWLEKHPNWDPRVRLANASEREFLIAERAKRGVQRFGGHPASLVDDGSYGDDAFDGALGGNIQFNGLCTAGVGKSMDLALMRMHLELGGMLLEEAEEGEQDPADLLDGMPDWFIGPMLADLVAHEVGHTIGLRHNFKASSMYSLEEINSEEVKGTPFTASVMDYIPININFESGEIQGDYAMVDIGAYDMKVIEFGYTDGDAEAVLDSVAAEGIPYATDYDTWGPDPLARRYDFSANPLDYANNQIRLIGYYRERLLDGFVDEGDSWAKARRGFNITLNQQLSMVSMMSNWIGGSYVHTDVKGQEGERTPIEPVDPETQREALEFVIKNAFYDESFGLDPEVLKYLTVDIWGDRYSNYFAEPAFPVHDRVLGIQASALTMLMNPTTLKHVHDNEFRTPEGEDALTLPELMFSVTDAIFEELDEKPRGSFSNREPMISSLRRNLQNEMLGRLIELTRPGVMSGSAADSVRTLAAHKLRELDDKIEKAAKGSGLDDYTLAHLSEAHLAIERALDAKFIYNAADVGGNGVTNIYMRETGDE